MLSRTHRLASVLQQNAQSTMDSHQTSQATLAHWQFDYVNMCFQHMLQQTAYKLNGRATQEGSEEYFGEHRPRHILRRKEKRKEKRRRR